MADNQKTLSPFFTTLVIMFSDCMPWIGALRKIFDIRSTVKYPVSVMLFGILIIRFLADLTQTFSSRQTLNPPYFTYMVNYQSNCLFVSFIRFIFFVFFFFFNMCFILLKDLPMFGHGKNILRAKLACIQFLT